MIRWMIVALLLVYGVADAGMSAPRRPVVTGSAGPTPIYHNQMDSVTNPHTPLIGVSTNVYGSPSISGDGVDFNSGSKAFVAQSMDWDESQGTMVVSLRPHWTGWPGGDQYIFCNSGINLFLKFTSSGIQGKYGSSDVYYYTNTNIVTDQLLTIRMTWEISGANVILKLYENEGATAVATTTTAQSVLSVAPQNIAIGDYTNGGGFYVNSVIEDFKIYNSVETP